MSRGEKMSAWLQWSMIVALAGALLSGFILQYSHLESDREMIKTLINQNAEAILQNSEGININRQSIENNRQLIDQLDRRIADD